MQYRILGRTGLRVSEIGFGGAQVGIPNYMETWDPRGEREQQTIVDALNRALDLGLNYVDTAPSYGDGTSEEVIGRVVGKRRDEIVLATKLSDYDHDSVIASVEQSLRRLQTDVIDVLQFHGGIYESDDLNTILNGGLKALRKLRDQGKIRFLGFTAELPSGGVSTLIATGAFDVMQIRYNYTYQCACDFINPRGVMREAEDQNMGIVIMRPLTSGIFQRLMARAFPEVASADLNAFLLNYVLSNPLVDVAIIGMRRAGEVEQNNALSDNTALRLDLEEVHDRFFPGP
ncbi:MAG: aldo/keto reductase [Armatimonadota bacterium]|nr:MAG: aldo/keto reductase [Armatimonadota bacterium]